MSHYLLWAAVVFWFLFATLYQVSSFGSLFLLLRRRVVPPARRPSFTFLRPLHGADPSKEVNLESLLSFGAPVVAGVRDVSDPGLQLALRVQARNPGARFSIRTGQGPPGANHKVSNLIQMLPAAEGEVLILTDADVRFHAGSLEGILAPFDDPGVALVTCPYRAVAGSSLIERLDVLSNNTLFLPSVAFAERLEGVRFGLGACIAVRRRALEEIGGLHFLLDVLPDDYGLAAAVRAAGWRVALSPVLLDHCMIARSFQVMARRHLRWACTTHSLRPWAHFFTVLTFGLPPALALTLLGQGAWPLLVWFLLRLGAPACLRSRLGVAVKDLLLLPFCDLWALLVLWASLFRPVVWWNDRRMLLGPGGAILAVEDHGARRRPRPRAAAARRAPRRSRSTSQKFREMWNVTSCPPNSPRRTTPVE